MESEDNRQTSGHCDTLMKKKCKSYTKKVQMQEKQTCHVEVPHCEQWRNQGIREQGLIYCLTHGERGKQTACMSHTQKV